MKNNKKIILIVLGIVIFLIVGVIITFNFNGKLKDKTNPKEILKAYEILENYSHEMMDVEYTPLIRRNKKLDYNSLLKDYSTEYYNPIVLMTMGYIIEDYEKDTKDIQKIVNDATPTIEYDISKKFFAKKYKELWNKKDIPYDKLKFKSEFGSFELKGDKIIFLSGGTGYETPDVYRDYATVKKVEKSNKETVITIEYLSIGDTTDEGTIICNDVEKKNKIAVDKNFDKEITKNSKNQIFNYLYKKYHKKTGKYKLTFRKKGNNYYWEKTEMVK